MDKTDKKRYTEEEKNFLLLMIDKFKNIIENKETDGASIQQKRKAWSEIQARFNSEPDHTERTVVQLQKCWDNIKTKRKKELTASKRAKFVTGGGPAPDTKGDSDDPIDAVILNATNIELNDTIDSDTVMLVSCGSETNPEYQLSSENILLDIPVGLPSSVAIEEVTASTSAFKDNDTGNDLNVSSEERSVSSRKRKLLTARQAAIDSELQVRLKKMGRTTEAENELHEIRKREAEVRYEIAVEDLKAAKLRTEKALKEAETAKQLCELRKETAIREAETEKYLCEMRIAFAKEKHEIEIQSLLKNKS